MEKRYIGDGVYVEIENDLLKLSTERLEESSLAVIYLGPQELAALNKYHEDAIEFYKTQSEELGAE